MDPSDLQSIVLSRKMSELTRMEGFCICSCVRCVTLEQNNAKMFSFKLRQENRRNSECRTVKKFDFMRFLNEAAADVHSLYISSMKLLLN